MTTTHPHYEKGSTRRPQWPWHVTDNSPPTPYEVSAEYPNILCRCCWVQVALSLSMTWLEYNMSAYENCSSVSLLAAFLFNVYSTGISTEIWNALNIGDGVHGSTFSPTMWIREDTKYVKSVYGGCHHFVINLYPAKSWYSRPFPRINNHP